MSHNGMQQYGRGRYGGVITSSSVVIQQRSTPRQRGLARTVVPITRFMLPGTVLLYIMCKLWTNERKATSSRVNFSCFSFSPAFWASHRERPGPNTAKSKDGSPPPFFLSRTLFLSSGSRRSFIFSSVWLVLLWFGHRCAMAGGTMARWREMAGWQDLYVTRRERSWHDGLLMYPHFFRRNDGFIIYYAVFSRGL